MGYNKIIYYGDTIEHYNYQKELKKRPLDALKAYRLQASKNNIKTTPLIHINTAKQRRKIEQRLYLKKKRLYEKSTSSINRTKSNFFRLCHHNNCIHATTHFLTITFAYDLKLKQAQRHVAHFLEKIRTHYKHIPISYISVPELQEQNNNRYHFHILIYNLPPETPFIERKTRNFQRQFQHGTLDISSTYNSSERIAGYMAKYMAKALIDFKNEATRAYTCSRNIKKITSLGSNTLSGYLDLAIPYDYLDIKRETSYTVPYLGRCDYKKIKIK